MKDFPLDRAFQFLEPGPVVLLTTKSKDKINVMTLTWHMVVDFTPKFACLVSECDYSFKALKSTKECVIAIPAVDLINKVVDIGNCSGSEIDKFERFKLTPLKGREVEAPLIKECIANIECRVTDTTLVNRHNLFIVEGFRAWHDPQKKERRTFHANGDGTFVVDGRTINLRERMTKWEDII